jgi:hypothetical protein
MGDWREEDDGDERNPVSGSGSEGLRAHKWAELSGIDHGPKMFSGSGSEGFQIATLTFFL